jgi:hypothetical protein
VNPARRVAGKGATAREQWLAERNDEGVAQVGVSMAGEIPELRKLICYILGDGCVHQAALNGREKCLGAGRCCGPRLACIQANE